MELLMRRNDLVLALLVVALANSAGCGSGDNVWVTGKLLKGGAAYVPPKGQLVSVTFVGLEIKDDSGKTILSGEPFSADVDQEDGSFFVPGPERTGIPRGKYRIAVTQKKTREEYEATKPKTKNVNALKETRETDMLQGRFGLTNSPITRVVKKGEELVIDLDKPGEST
jgi:hypothetical protein